MGKWKSCSRLSFSSFDIVCDVLGWLGEFSERQNKHFRYRILTDHVGKELMRCTWVDRLVINFGLAKIFPWKSQICKLMKFHRFFLRPSSTTEKWNELCNSHTIVDSLRISFHSLLHNSTNWSMTSVVCRCGKSKCISWIFQWLMNEKIDWIFAVCSVFVVGYVKSLRLWSLRIENLVRREWKWKHSTQSCTVWNLIAHKLKGIIEWWEKFETCQSSIINFR